MGTKEHAKERVQEILEELRERVEKSKELMSNIIAMSDPGRAMEGLLQKTLPITGESQKMGDLRDTLDQYIKEIEGMEKFISGSFEDIKIHRISCLYQLNNIGDVKIEKCGSINAFVGQNNTQKSRHLREMAKANRYGWVEWEEFCGLVSKFVDICRLEEKNLVWADFLSVRSQTNNNDEWRALLQAFAKWFSSAHKKEAAQINQKVNELRQTLDEEALSYHFYIPTMRGLRVPHALDGETTQLMGGFDFTVDGYHDYEVNKEGSEHFYEKIEEDEEKDKNIKINRYLPRSENKGKMLFEVDGYATRTNNDYFNEETADIVFTGLTIWRDVVRALLATPEERKFIEEFQKFIGKHFFGGEKNFYFTYPNAQLPLHVKIGDEPTRDISQLGDGVQQLIIMLLPIFLHENVPMTLFIEEPELFLHPSYQTKLMKCFQEKIEERKNTENPLWIFFTTHSSHIIDYLSGYDGTCIYLFSKKDDTVEVQQYDKINLDIVQELGMSPSFLLQRCNVFFEGITDMINFRWMWKIYCEHLKALGKPVYDEYHHFNLTVTGGKNALRHLAAQKDSNKILVLGKSIFILDYDDAFWVEEEKTFKSENYTMKVEGIDASNIYILENARTIECCITISDMIDVLESSFRIPKTRGKKPAPKSIAEKLERKVKYYLVKRGFFGKVKQNEYDKISKTQLPATPSGTPLKDEILDQIKKYTAIRKDAKKWTDPEVEKEFDEIYAIVEQMEVKEDKIVPYMKLGKDSSQGVMDVICEVSESRYNKNKDGGYTDKVAWSQAVKKHMEMKSYKDLSEPAQKLVEAVYEFLQRSYSNV